MTEIKIKVSLEEWISAPCKKGYTCIEGELEYFLIAETFSETPESVFNDFDEKNNCVEMILLGKSGAIRRVVLE